MLHGPPFNRKVGQAHTGHHSRIHERRPLSRPHLPTSPSQVTGYVNRFGPGLVIFWFGFVAGLADVTSSVLILDDFPEPLLLPTGQVLGGNRTAT